MSTLTLTHHYAKNITARSSNKNNQKKSKIIVALEKKIHIQIFRVFTNSHKNFLHSLFDVCTNMCNVFFLS